MAQIISHADANNYGAQTQIKQRRSEGVYYPGDYQGAEIDESESTNNNMIEDNYPPNTINNYEGMPYQKTSLKPNPLSVPDTMVQVEDERPDFEGSAKYRAKKIIMK